MLPSLDETMPESVISQENNSPLTLYSIEFHNCFSSWISIVQLIKFNHRIFPTFIYIFLTHLSIQVEGRCIFMKSKNFVKFVYSSIRQLYCCDITDISTVPPERVAYKKLTRTLKNDSS